MFRRERIAQVERLRIAVPAEARKLSRHCFDRLRRRSKRALVCSQTNELGPARLPQELFGTDKRRRLRNCVDGGSGTNHASSQETVDAHDGTGRPFVVALVHDDVSVRARRQANGERAQRQRISQRQFTGLFDPHRNVPRPFGAAARRRARRACRVGTAIAAPASAATIGLATASRIMSADVGLPGRPIIGLLPCRAEERRLTRLDAKAVHDDAGIGDRGDGAR